MSGNSIGQSFRVTSWGESHGTAIGVVVDGCPPNIKLDQALLQKELDLRKPGQSTLSTQRKEEDLPRIMSGVFEGKTTGAPISIIIENKDTKKSDYKEISKVFRPGHADLTYHEKYGLRDPCGGGRSSARITAGNVAAGAVAKAVLAGSSIEIIAYAKSIGKAKAEIDEEKISRNDVIKSIVRCPDKAAEKKMISEIESAKQAGDSVGGTIECVIRGVPAGLGEPVFDKISADLAKAVMSINACKGFEIGNGFMAAEILGSENNDLLYYDKKTKKVMTQTNNSGGILGGITNGMPLVFRAAFKPVPTIAKKQQTVDTAFNQAEIIGKGRHDPCVIPRAVVIVEAMAAIVVCDHLLRHRAQCGGK